LDDFGTGHSALNQLRILPISQIKIDRSFIQNFLTDRTDYMMVSSIIGLAKNFNLEVVAEGIETMEQFTTLSELGCQKVQGYLFSKPLETSAFDGWVNNYNELNLLPEQRLQTKKDRMKSKGRA
jgi:EAL domain-containing protein (putative c-di-GMP-specific phosphodiesterase class I)